MKSRITIEVDFENGNLPVIQILQQDSDDVRDRLIKSFTQSLQHTSRWCKILYQTSTEQEANSPIHRWHIVPITPMEINEEVALMRSTMYKLGRTMNGKPIGSHKTDLELLLESNEIIRSFYSVIERKGEDTNWEALHNKIKAVLEEQHMAIAKDRTIQ